MLETIREYALERLDESGDADELRRRHAAFFFELAAIAREARRYRPRECRAGGWTGSPPKSKTFAVCSRGRSTNDVGEGLRFAAALGTSGGFAATTTSSHAGSTAAFQRAEAVPAGIRMQALMTYGDLQSDPGGEQTSAGAVRGRPPPRSAVGDECAEAWFLNQLGITTRIDGNCEEALALHEQALETYRRLGDLDGGGARCIRRRHAPRSGPVRRAAEMYEEAIAIYESLDKLWNASLNVLDSLADAALDQRDAQRATDRYREALCSVSRLDDKRQGRVLPGGSVGRCGTFR